MSALSQLNQNRRNHTQANQLNIKILGEVRGFEGSEGSEGAPLRPKAKFIFTRAPFFTITPFYAEALYLLCICLDEFMIIFHSLVSHPGDIPLFLLGTTIPPICNLYYGISMLT